MAQPIPRYAKAAEYRMSRLKGQYLKDREGMRVLKPCLERFETVVKEYPDLIQVSPEAHYYRWMLEEFRVSLFAQRIRTRMPVSSKRLDLQWRSIENWLNQNSP